MALDQRILIVDDDDGLRSLMASYLGRFGFETDTAPEPSVMREKLAERRFDLVVLDVMMPGEDGLSVLKNDLQDGPAVIMLSGVADTIDRIVGLELGADDYLSKPCEPRELLARIRSVLRRRTGSQAPSEFEKPAAEPAGAITFAGWRLTPETRSLVDPGGALVTLTDGEFRLLMAFVERPRRVLTRDQLLDLTRGSASESYDRAIDVQVSRLRRKLLAHDAETELIRTVRNEGYLFVPAVSRA